MKVVLILAILLPVSLLTSQELTVIPYKPQNGTLLSGANAILQDDQGWMWFTSGYEVVRYDGHEFVVYPPKHGHQMDFCFNLLQVRDEIWVVADPYLMYVDGDSLAIHRHAPLPASITSSLHHGHQHFLLADGGLWKLVNDTFEEYLRHPSLQFHHDESLIPYSDSILLAPIFNKALAVFDLAENSVGIINLPVNDISLSRTGDILLLIHEIGIAKLLQLKYTAGKWQYAIDMLHGFNEPKAEYLEMDHQGQCWVGVFEKFLLRIDAADHHVRYTETDGLPGLWFYDMRLDREGNLWIGFNSGVAKIPSTTLTRFTRDQGLLSNHIAFVMQPAESTAILVGTYNGVNMVSPHGIDVVQLNQVPLMCTHMISVSETCYFINGFDLFTGTFDARDHAMRKVNKLATLPAKPLHLDADSKGHVFIATDAGLYRWDGKMPDALPVPKEHYHCALIDEHDNLWAGSFTGQLQWYTADPLTGKYTANAHAQALLSRFPDLKQIRSILPASPGIVYVGTRYNGLYRMTYDKKGLLGIDAFGVEEGLQSNSIWGLSCDSTGMIWIATAKGLQSLNPRTGGFRDQGAANGIYHAAHVFADRTDQIWVASHPGISLLHRAQQPGIPFDASISHLHVNGSSVPLAKDLSIRSYSHKQNQFSFTFSSNTFRNEQAVRYQYRLQRNGKGEWSLLTPGHTTHYPALRPGNYTFAVRAQNQDGQWSSHDDAYSFTINPPFWQTPWFVSLVFILFTAALYSLYRYRVQQILKLQLIRNNISKDLHDDIGASLSNIHILTSLAQRNIHEPSQAVNYLEQAGEDIHRISESLSDIVWNINPQHDELEPLLSRMKRYAADMLEGHQIEAHIRFPEVAQNTPIAMEKRRDFLLIFKEAIHNLIRHSKASAASIEILDHKDSLSLIIRDNGIGFDQDIQSEGNGLKNMRLRARQMNADLHIRSKAGEGTTVQLDMEL